MPLIEYTKNARRRTVSAAIAKVLISRNLARAVEEGPIAEEAAPTYRTRMLQAEPVATPKPARKSPARKVAKESTEVAPYGYKADGTPRKRPAPKAKG